MTQPPRAIYLPPGMTLGPVSPPPVSGNGAPFDRAFFEQILPQSVQAFCTQTECPMPVVELLTADGVTHYVNGISGVADQWVALQTSSVDHARPVQVFLPYSTIFRVEIHPEPANGRGHLGFDVVAAQQPATAVGAPPAKAKKSR